LLSRSFLSGFWIWNHLFCPFFPPYPSDQASRGLKKF
jgi:hypothetical protein